MKTEIVPGCLCLAFDPMLSEPQECVAEELYKKGEVTMIKGGKVGTPKYNIWGVDRDLRYKCGRFYSSVREQYLIRIDGHDATEDIRAEIKRTDKA